MTLQIGWLHIAIADRLYWTVEEIHTAEVESWACMLNTPVVSCYLMDWLIDDHALLLWVCQLLKGMLQKVNKIHFSVITSPFVHCIIKRKLFYTFVCQNIARLHTKVKIYGNQILMLIMLILQIPESLVLLKRVSWKEHSVLRITYLNHYRCARFAHQLLHL